MPTGTVGKGSGQRTASARMMKSKFQKEETSSRPQKTRLVSGTDCLPTSLPAFTSRTRTYRPKWSSFCQASWNIRTSPRFRKKSSSKATSRWKSSKRPVHRFGKQMCQDDSLHKQATDDQVHRQLAKLHENRQKRNITARLVPTQHCTVKRCGLRVVNTWIVYFRGHVQQR